MKLSVLITAIILTFVFFCIWKSKKEDFKVLGAMGNQNELYYKCLYECERSDPGKQMTPTKGSRTCLAYCDSIITDIARRGGPSYPLDLQVVGIPVETAIDSTYEKCGDGTHGARCRSLLATASEIDQKCRQDCEYSTLPGKMCMNQCSQSRSSNKSSGWSWK
jgi:hypothetical protein